VTSLGRPDASGSIGTNDDREAAQPAAANTINTWNVLLVLMSANMGSLGPR